MGRRNWSREDLVKLPDCDYNCLSKLCCTAEVCVRNKGFFKDGEKGQFSIDEQEEIERLWSNEKGFWSADGCRLPKKMRAFDCLSYDCRYVPPGVAH